MSLISLRMSFSHTEHGRSAINSAQAY